jgi:hypothetical protein
MAVEVLALQCGVVVGAIVAFYPVAHFLICPFGFFVPQARKPRALVVTELCVVRRNPAQAATYSLNAHGEGCDG